MRSLTRLPSPPSQTILAAQQAALQQRQVQARELKKEAADNSLLIARSRGTEYNDAAFKRNSVRQGEAAARERKRREKVMMVEFLRKRAEEQRSEEVDEARSLPSCGPCSECASAWPSCLTTPRDESCRCERWTRACVRFDARRTSCSPRSTRTSRCTGASICARLQHTAFLAGPSLKAVRCVPQDRREAIVEIESTLGQQRGSGLSIARQIGGSGASSRASLRGQ